VLAWFGRIQAVPVASDFPAIQRLHFAAVALVESFRKAIWRLETLIVGKQDHRAAR
jgi:hypothetical protein